MAVQKELSCPHCKKSLPFGEGFKHDEKLNFICSHCKKIIFPVTEEDENELKKCFSGSTSRGVGFGYGYNKEPLPISLGELQEIDKEKEKNSPQETDIMSVCEPFC